MLIDELKKLVETDGKKKLRWDNIIKRLTEEMKSVARNGSSVYETPYLGCYPQEEYKVVEHFKKEGLKVTSFFRDKQSTGFNDMFGVHDEQETVWVFKWY